MILTAETVTLIQQGKVTCLIVPAAERGRYHVGESYPVQWWKPREGGGAPVVSEEKLRVTVTALERTTLSYELRPDVIERAGFDTPGDLWEFWRVQYRSGPLADPPIVVVHFERDPVARERYLLPKGGYTSSPRMALRTEVSGEPVAPDLEVERAVPQSVQRDLTRRAKEVWREGAVLRRQQREADARRRSQPVRLAEAKRRARLAGIDVSSDERVIEDRIARMERKVDREPNGDQEAA